MKLVVTRPEADAPGLAASVRQRGHEVVIAPLLAIKARREVKIPNRAYQVIAVTSANGPRSLAIHARRTLNLATQVLAVGAQSAAAAQALGFSDVTAAGGDVRGLVAHIKAQLNPRKGPVLYLSGAETSGDLEGQLKTAGFDVERVVTYDAIAQPLDRVREQIAESDGVLLYSPRSAKLWQSELARLGLARALLRLRHYCLSAQVAANLPPNTHISIAAEPTDVALLGLLDLASKAE
jgi:uroporphyrinogen-III synthase